jgi:hypothetical protein
MIASKLLHRASGSRLLLAIPHMLVPAAAAAAAAQTNLSLLPPSHTAPQ